MDLDFCMHLVFIGVGVILLATILECSVHTFRDKFGLDKDYYIITQKDDYGEDRIFKTNEIRINIVTNEIEFKDYKTKKHMKIQKGYTYKEITKNEWLSLDNND